MAKRKPVAPDIALNATAGAAAPSGSPESASESIMDVDAPRLVPEQSDAGASRAAETGLRRLEPPRPQAHSADIVAVSFIDAEREARYRAAEDDVADSSAKTEAFAAFARARRFIPLAAAVAIAAAIGALTGALTTAGLSGQPVPAVTAANDDGQALKDAIAKIGNDLAALKGNVEGSTKSASTQLAKLSERIEKSDRAQADAAGKLAKLTDTLEKRTFAAAPAGSDITGSIAPAAPAPVISPPATRPVAVVDDWVLRSVQNGTALIQGRIGLVEVEPGDNLPGLGRIETIRRQDGRWVVVTSRGLVVSR